MTQMLVVVVTESIPAGVRGDLTRWLLELKPGVFVGNVSARVRDRLWERLAANASTGACWLIQEAPSEQRMAIRTHREPTRALRDFEGLQLIELQ